MISGTKHNSREHPQPRLVQAAMDCVVEYLRQKRLADLGRLRRILLPSNPGLLLLAIDRLIEQGIIVTRSNPFDVLIELADSPAREVRR